MPNPVSPLREENEKTNKTSVYFHQGGALYNMLLLKIKALKNKLAKLHPPKKYSKSPKDSLINVIFAQ